MAKLPRSLPWRSPRRNTAADERRYQVAQKRWTASRKATPAAQRTDAETPRARRAIEQRLHEDLTKQGWF
jgi:hypothetical protein